MFLSVPHLGKALPTNGTDVRLSSPELLTGAHDLTGFDCGKPALNTWLQQRALANQERGFTAVLVVHEEMRVRGYYGLAPTSVVPSVLSRALRTGQPPDPVPCILIGQLATDLAATGHGIGSALLAHALRRCVEASHLVGGRAVIVRAIDNDAAAFWRARGFQPSRDDGHILFQSMGAIAASLAAASG